VRALLVGSGGMLGTELRQLLLAGAHEVEPLTLRDLDITDAAAVEAAIARWSGPDGGTVFNCAAYTNVDGAETNEATAHLVNAAGPANLARSSAANGIGLVHLSTDYVFPGDASTPYAVDAPTGPRSAYGRTKLEGEEAVRSIAPHSYVVRTAWLYGAGGHNFVKTMARLERERESLSVVDDQRGSPTWSRDLAEALVALAQTGSYGGFDSMLGALEAARSGVPSAGPPGAEREWHECPGHYGDGGSGGRHGDGRRTAQDRGGLEPFDRCTNQAFSQAPERSELEQ
jgi:dTDP-4-dehydrorhamnose reductase